MTKHFKAYLALIYICIMWGTTYLVIRVGVQHYPALLFAGVRQLVGGIILMPLALLANRKTNLSYSNLLRQALVGFLMLTVGNGCVTWAEKFVPSGVAALLCAMMPLFAVLINLVSSKKEHFNLQIGMGLVMGAGGVSLIFRNSLAYLANPSYLAGMSAIVFGTAGWAMGSIISKKSKPAVNPLFNAGMQLSFGGIFMLLLSPFTDSYKGFEPWNTPALLSLVYLVIFGSVLAYAAYMYVLSVLPVGIATIYAYINPLIAVLAGAVLLHEPLGLFILLAFVAIILGVYMVNRGYRQQHPPTLKTNEPIPAEVLQGQVTVDS